MVDSDQQRDRQRELDTRDSLATVNRRRIASKNTPRLKDDPPAAHAASVSDTSAPNVSALGALNVDSTSADSALADSSSSARLANGTVHADAGDATLTDAPASVTDTATTQVLPPSFIPTATGRIRPMTGAFPAIQSTSQQMQSQRGRSVKSSSVGALNAFAGATRKTERIDPSTVMQGDAQNAAPRIASSAPHYMD